MPGGVNSPVRSFNAVVSTPVFVFKAQGQSVYDVDGSAYFDYMTIKCPLLYLQAPKAWVFCRNI